MNTENKLIPTSSWLESLSNREKNIEGLMTSLLLKKAAERNLDLKELAGKIGLSYGYLIQLKNGERKYAGLPGEALDAISTFLDIPPLTTYVLAEKIPLNVLLQSPETSLQSDVESGFFALKNDPTYGPLLTKELDALNWRSKVMLVVLYEHASNKTLIRRIDKGDGFGNMIEKADNPSAN